MNKNQQGQLFVDVLQKRSKKVVKNICVRACVFNKKLTLPQVFSCQYCKIFKNGFFIEHLQWLLLNQVKISESSSFFSFWLFQQSSFTSFSQSNMRKKEQALVFNIFFLIFYALLYFPLAIFSLKPCFKINCSKISATCKHGRMHLVYITKFLFKIII